MPYTDRQATDFFIKLLNDNFAGDFKIINLRYCFNAIFSSLTDRHTHSIYECYYDFDTHYFTLQRLSSHRINVCLEFTEKEGVLYADN